MHDFLSKSFFNNKVNYCGEDYSVVAQIYIELEKCALPLVLLKSGEPKLIAETDYYTLFYADFNCHSFAPIYNRFADRILEIIKKIPDRKYILNTNFNYVGIKIGRHIKINNKFYIATTDYCSSNQSSNICLQFGDPPTIKALSFCHVAYDDMDKRIFFEVESSTILSKKSYHTLDGIHMYDGSNPIGIFHPYSICHKNAISTFFCYSQVYMKSKNIEVTRMHMHNLNIFESIEFLIRIGGFAKWKVAVPENYPVQYLWYTVTIPIRNLNIESNFGIGNVRFINDSKLNMERFKDYFVNNRPENMPKTFAVIHVNAKSFFDALNICKLQIQQSLDFLVNLARDDSMLFGHAAFEELSKKQLLDLEPVPILDSWTCIEIPYHDKSIVFDQKNNTAITELIIRNELIDKLQKFEHVELELIASINNEKNKVVPVFNALKWIRKAWDSGETDDKIIYSVIALEFVVGDEISIPLISKPHRKLLKNHIKEKLREIDGSRKDFEKYAESICGGFDHQFTDSPFMVKLEALISRLDIPITKMDLSLIKDARKIRNDIVHGRNSNSLSPDEIRKLCEIISQIVFYKMRCMEVEIL